MKKMKIYLKYPWKVPDSPYYKYLIDNPPKNVEYLNIKKQKGVITNTRKFRASDNLKNAIKKFLTKIPIPIPNAHLVRTDEEYDLIHCAHCLSLNKKNWITDIEFLDQFWGSVKVTPLREKIVGKILSSVYCKKIMPWTNKTKIEILKIYPHLKNKLEVVYPAIPLPKIKSKLKKHKITLSFIGRYFYAKGGLHAVEVIDRLTKKYNNVEGVVVSEPVEEVISRYKNNKKIKFFDLMEKDQLDKIYSISDILVYPGYSDSFGFIFLEAMSFGIPVVTVDGRSRNEIVTDKKSGFIIKRNDFNVQKTKGEKNIDEIEKKVDFLIKNPKLLREMGIYGKNEIKSGKFSIVKRNKKMSKIYQESLF